MEQMKEDVSRVKMFIKTRQRPTNKPVMEQMKKRLEVLEYERTEEFKEAIFIETFGREKGHGRVRTWGVGPSLTDIFGSKSSSTPYSDRIQKLIEEKVQMMMSEYEKQHKEKMEKLDDFEKQQKEKLENINLIVPKYKTEMVGRGVPDPAMTPLNPSSVGQCCGIGHFITNYSTFTNR